MNPSLKTHAPAMEAYRCFTRPSIYESIKTVLDFFNLQGSMNIYYNGDAEITKLVGSNYDESASDSLYTDGHFRNKVFVVANVAQSPFNSGYHNQRRESTEAYFWQDPTVNLGLSPTFEGRTVTVEIMTHFHNRRDAEAFINTMNFTRSQLITDFTFNPIGHLPVNDGLLEIIKNIHTLLVKNKVRTDGFFDYLTACSLRPFTILSNLGGNNKTLAYPIKIRDVLIQFEDAEIKLAQKAEIFGQYEVSFAYSFFHNEFIGWDINYPLSIYQDQIDDKWIPKPRQQFTQSVLTYGDIAPETGAAIRFIDDTRSVQTPFYLSLPSHDNWIKPDFGFITPVIQVRLVTTPQDSGEQLLCNIFDIPGFNWNDISKAYILRRCDYVFKYHFAPFFFELYADELQILPSQCRLDNLGNVYVSRPPTMFRKHHLIISIDNDIAGYDQSVWDDLRDNPEDAEIIKNIFPNMPWDTLPTDWQEDAPYNLPLNLKPAWNNYEMYLDLVAGNIRTLSGN